MFRRSWHLETFVGERLRLTLGPPEGGPERAQSNATEEHERARWLGSLMFALDEGRRRVLEELYRELTGRSMPHEYRPFDLAADRWERELTRVLEAAADAGFLRIEPVVLQRVAVRQDPPLVAPLGPSAPEQELQSRFEVRLVDEIGEPLGDVELAFSSGRTKETQKTDGDGVARFASQDASFGSVRVVSTSALSKVLEERWQNPRTGAVPDAPFLQRVVWSGELPSFPLESDARHTIVFQPEQGKLLVELWDKRGKRRHADAAYTIQGPATFEGKTDAQGRLLHENVPPGDYTLTLTQTFPEDLKLAPEEHETPLVALRATERQSQVRLLGMGPRCTLARLRGAVFDTNKCFVLPTALPGLSEILGQYRAQNPCKLLIVGHTDATGDASASETTSLERSKALEQLLQRDADAWAKNYDAGVPKKKRWGAREDRLMLLKLESFGGRDPSEDRVRWFQKHHNTLVESGGKPGRSSLQVDGKLGPKTRTELIWEYMGLDGATLAGREDIVMDVRAHGSGENFPLAATGFELDRRAASGSESQKPRDGRVEFFFFEDEYGVVPAPGDAKGTEYLSWRSLSEADQEVVVAEFKNQARVMHLPSAHFRTGSAVLLPEGEAPTTGQGTALTSVGMLATALRFNEEHPGHSVLVAGHADSVGNDKSNDQLSAQRAELTHAVLAGNREKFAELAQQTGKVSDWKQIFRWASVALSDIEPPPGSAAPVARHHFNEIVVEPIDDNATTGVPAAIAFQNAYNENRAALGVSGDKLTVDGIVGKKTWGAIFDCYQWNMAEELGEVEFEDDQSDATKRLAGLKKLQSTVTFLPTRKPFIGFGEHFPADGAGDDNVASEANRRVEVLFFEQGQEPDVEVLDEAPETTELYQADSFERVNVPERAGGARKHLPFRIRLLDPLGVPMDSDAVEYTIRQASQVIGEGTAEDAFAVGRLLPGIEREVYVTWGEGGSPVRYSRLLHLTSARPGDARPIVAARLGAMGMHSKPHDDAAFLEAMKTFANVQRLPEEVKSAEAPPSSLVSKLKEFFEKLLEAPLPPANDDEIADGPPPEPEYVPEPALAECEPASDLA